jgi:hypothetical protein
LKRCRIIYRRGFRPLRCHAIDPELLTNSDVPLTRLQSHLEEAITNEDYEGAAQLRDEIQ